MAAIRIRSHVTDRVIHARSVTIDSLTFEPVDTIDESSNPEAVLIRKIEALAELLDCSEAEAQRLIFKRCDYDYI